MKNKYLFVLICFVVLLAVILPSCGGGDNTTPKTTTPPTTSAASGDSLTDILGLGEGIDTFKFDMVMTATGSETITITIWQKHQKMREDMTMEGQTVSILFNPDENVMYMYYPTLNYAMEMPLDESMIPEDPVDNTSDILDYDPNVVGTETIDGKVCAVVAYEMPGEGSVKMWIWKDKGFPLKMEMTANGQTTTIEYKNISFSDIPDSAFELPDGVTIVPAGG